MKQFSKEAAIPLRAIERGVPVAGIQRTKPWDFLPAWGGMLLITGGSKSGKSRFAEAAAQRLAHKDALPLVYLATMDPGGDLENLARIKRHQDDRRQKGFLDLEAYQALSERMDAIPKHAVLLLECLGTTLANRLFDRQTGVPHEALLHDPQRTAALFLAELKALAEPLAQLLIVSNELYHNPVTPGPESKAYVEILGRLVQLLHAQEGCRCVEVAAGIPVLYPKEGHDA